MAVGGEDLQRVRRMAPVIIEKVLLRFQPRSLSGDDFLAQQQRGLSNWYGDDHVLAELLVDGFHIVIHIPVIAVLMPLQIR